MGATGIGLELSFQLRNLWAHDEAPVVKDPGDCAVYVTPQLAALRGEIDEFDAVLPKV
jgi:hypothetical protein